MVSPVPRKSANPAWLKPSESRMARISSGDGVRAVAAIRKVRTVATRSSGTPASTALQTA